MDFLTQLRHLEPKELYSNGALKILDINGTTSIDDTDKVIIVPYYVNKRGIVLRYEALPEFEIKQKGVSHYITCKYGDINNGADVMSTVKSELLSAFGIRVFLDDKITITNPIFLTKGQSMKYYFAFVMLYEGQYEEVEVTEFQKLEFKDKNAFVGLDDLNNCVFYDLLTKYSIDYLKEKILLF